MSIPPDRSVLTLSLGPEVYWAMAINLARSVQRWHPATTLPITIVTDRTDCLPADLAHVRVHRIAAGELGRGFETKLHLDHLAPSGQTLFIDADCLVYEPLDRLFERLRGRPVATIGGEVSEGEWFGDVGDFCRRLGVAALPKFNGGVYYLEQGAMTEAVFGRARELKSRYDELGLVRLRGRPNDELLIAGAMAMHGLKALPDDGSYLADPQSCPGPLAVNVLSGRRRLYNPPAPSPLHQAWYPFTAVSPAIVHFLGDHTTRVPYRTEAMRLALSGRTWPLWLADATARFVVTLPGTARETAKWTLRPLYRRLFGFRPVKSTPRLS